MSAVIDIKTKKPVLQEWTPPPPEQAIRLKKTLKLGLPPMQTPMPKPPHSPSRALAWLRKILSRAWGWYTYRRASILVGQMTTLALKVNSREKFTVFVDYSGHVHQIVVTVHQGGWKPNNGGNSEKLLYGYLPTTATHPLTIKQLKQAIKKLKILYQASKY